MHHRTAEPTVLLVDDESSLLALHETILGAISEVYTATGGDEALALVDESVDVVLLDRRMPGMSGDEVLLTLRERGYDMSVGIVSGIQPDHDILDLPLDAYLTKPIGPDTLRETVELLAVRAEFDAQCREFFRLAAKQSTLEAAGTVDTHGSEQFQDLQDRVDGLRADIEVKTGAQVPRPPADISESKEFLTAVRDSCTPS